MDGRAQRLGGKTQQQGVVEEVLIDTSSSGRCKTSTVHNKSIDYFKTMSKICLKAKNYVSGAFICRDWDKYV